MSDAGWRIEPLPRATVTAVRESIEPLVAEIVAAVSSDSAVYGEVLASPDGIGIRLGIDQAIRAFLDAVESGERPRAGTAELWRRLGEAEFQAGRGLEPLRAAFRTGTRAAWRGAAGIAAGAGVPTAMVISLAEAIFVFTDELASEVVEGYLRIQSDEAGERERRRRRLATLLVDPAGHDPEAIERAAELARWPVPRTVAVLALDGPTPGGLTRRIDADVLAGSDAAGAFLMLGDPDGPARRATVDRAVSDTPAALGPTVSPREAHRSLRWARLALTLRQQGAIPAGGLTRVAEHLASLIVLQDEALARTLVASRLAPLSGLGAVERERALETLEAWLAHQRHTPDIAAALSVHPQTVRYRIARLRELMGAEMDDPRGRLELEMALRAQRALDNRPAV